MSASIGNDHICTINLHGRLECFKDDLSNISKNENENVDYVIGKSQNKFYGPNSQIVSGKNHACSFSQMQLATHIEVYQPYNEIECFGGSEHHQTLVPQTVIDNINDDSIIKSGSDMSCAINNYNIIGCWGKIIPDIDYLHLYSNLYKYFEIGLDDTVCGYYYDKSNYNSHNHDIPQTPGELQCMGKCTNSLCDVPRLEMYHQTQILQLTVGTDHACTVYHYLYSDIPNNIVYLYDVYCWGGEDYGQTSLPQDIRRNQVTVYAGNYSTCAIKQLNHYMLCWGKSSYIPYSVLNFYRQAVAGGRHLCALGGGQLKCKGNNMFNQISFKKSVIVNTYSLAAGWEFTCLIDMNKRLNCNGINIHGQTAIPRILSCSKSYVSQVSSGLSHSCAIYRYNLKINIICWGGTNEYNQLDIPNLYSYKTKYVTVGDDHTCLSYEFNFINKLRQNFVNCFGSNEYGQVDIPSHIENNDLINNLLTAGGDHSCSYSYSFNYSFNQSLLKCWGSNLQGQLDTPGKYYSYVYALSSGVSTSCAIFGYQNYKNEYGEKYGFVQCWGAMKYNSENFQNVHLKHGKKLKPVKITIGYEFICVITKYGKLYCLGTDEENIFDLESRIENKLLTE